MSPESPCQLRMHLAAVTGDLNLVASTEGSSLSFCDKQPEGGGHGFDAVLSGFRSGPVCLRSSEPSLRLMSLGHKMAFAAPEIMSTFEAGGEGWESAAAALLFLPSGGARFFQGHRSLQRNFASPTAPPHPHPRLRPGRVERMHLSEGWPLRLQPQ